MILATLTLVLAGTAAAQAPAAKSAPISVDVQVAAKSGAGAHAWEKELRAALQARKDEFRLVQTGEKAELVVKVDSVSAPPSGGSVMSGALVMGTLQKPFNLSYPGEIRPQAEGLARNLRKVVEQMKTAPPAAKGK